MSQPLRVLLADDHHLLVNGFKSTLSSYGIEVAGVAYSLEELDDCYESVSPDVLVIDVRFDSRNAGKTGLDACEEILAEHPKAKIVVFSQFDDLWIVERAYKIGALAFVRKDENTDVLHEAINTVAKGQRYISPVIAQQLAMSSIETRNPLKALTASELKSFTLYANGSTFHEIAIAQGVTYKTIVLHFKDIKSKLGIESQAAATKLAIKYGITTTDLL